MKSRAQVQQTQQPLSNQHWATFAGETFETTERAIAESRGLLDDDEGNNAIGLFTICSDFHATTTSNQEEMLMMLVVMKKKLRERQQWGGERSE